MSIWLFFLQYSALWIILRHNIIESMSIVIKLVSIVTHRSFVGKDKSFDRILDIIVALKVLFAWCSLVFNEGFVFWGVSEVGFLEFEILDHFLFEDLWLVHFLFFFEF